MRLPLVIFFSAIFFLSHSQTLNLFVGTYTGSGSKGIYVYHFNTTTGRVDSVTNTDEANTDSVINPSYLAISKNGNYVFAVNETHGDNGGSVSSFSFDKDAGTLKFISSQSTAGDDPCYVSVTKNNKWIAVANYNGGSVLIFPVNNDGSLQPHVQLIQDSGSSANKARQEKAHVHAAVFSPDEHFLFTPDLGMDKVMIYSFNPASAKLLRPSEPSFMKTGAGNGPRHFTFHPNQKFAYLAEELSGTVSAYTYSKGNLKFIQRVISHPKNYKGDIGSADIHISPDGKFLYVSNRGDENTIAIFSIDKNTGKLSPKGYQSTMGKTPRNFIIDPTGNFLLVANQNTDNIVVFKRNKQTGLLQQTGDEIKVPKPVCLQMSR